MTETLTSLSPEAKQFYDRVLLRRALPILGLSKIGQARNIPKNGGNQVSYRRFNTIPTSTVALTEGITPPPASLSVTEVTGTVQEYGNFVQMSDAIDLMGIDKVLVEANEVLGENAGQSVEEIHRAEVVTGTSVIYATGSTRGAQSAANPITLALVRRAVRNLMANDASPFYGDRDERGMGGMYVGWIHPNQWFDLTGDGRVLDTFTYSDPTKLYTLKIPELAQVAWIVSTKAPVFAGAGSAGATVYAACIFGKDAFGVTNVGGTGKFQAIAKPLGSAGTADPLNQRATSGWKSFQLPKILNNNFFTRIESGASA
jgi:N4-gp56 family major capsid protein